MRGRIAAEMWRVTAPGGAVVSFDISPPSTALRLLGRYTGWRTRAQPADPEARTIALGAGDLRALFPYGEHRIRRAGLRLDLGEIAGRGRALGLLAVAAPLRTHLLAVINKPY